MKSTILTFLAESHGNLVKPPLLFWLWKSVFPPWKEEKRLIGLPLSENLHTTLDFPPLGGGIQYTEEGKTFFGKKKCVPQTEEEEEKFVEVGGDSSIPLSPSLSRPQRCICHIFPAAQKQNKGAIL